MMLAGLVHDVDHPGYTNTFIQNTNSPLSKLYSNSFLEYHHAWMGQVLIEVSSMPAYKLYVGDGYLFVFYILEIEYTSAAEHRSIFPFLAIFPG